MRARRGRPHVPFSRTEDAACLFRELKRRGLQWRAAVDAVTELLGTPKSAIERYNKHHPVTPASEDSDRNNAQCVLSKHWRAFVLPRWTTLPPEVREIVRDMAPRCFECRYEGKAITLLELPADLSPKERQALIKHAYPVAGEPQLAEEPQHDDVRPEKLDHDTRTQRN